MKKFLSILLLLCIVAGCFVACANTGDKGTETSTKKENETNAPAASLEGTYDVTIWVSEIAGVKELTQKQIAQFEKDNPGIKINAKIEGITEKESATTMINDVENGADIFCFAQDQLSRLVLAGALTKLGTATANQVKELNDAGSVAAATVGDSLYCFPMTSDNGYFMYYDKSVISEEHLNSLEDLIADCEAANKLFSFNLEGSAWYAASFFFATGCKSDWTTNTAGDFTAYEDTFNTDAGVIALKGMQKLLQSKAYHDSSNGADFAAAVPSAIVISGAWDAKTVQEALGENYGVAKLPSFTVDGKTYQLGSFSGNKLMGVKPQTDAKKAAVLQKLALYLTGETCQAQRFAEFSWGPSNKIVAASAAVQENAALAALAAQSAFATPQGQFPGGWWDAGKAIPTAAKQATAGDETALKAALQVYADAIKGMLTVEP